MRETILFAGLDDEQLDHIAAAGSVQSLQRGIVVFDEGAEPGEFYLVLSGRVAIAQESDDGRESLLAVLGPGELFGEMGFLDGYNRSAQARALEESQVLMVPYAELRLLYESNPSALWSAVQLLARRLRAMDQALSDTVFLDVMGRTAKRLLEMAGDRDEFEMPLTQEETGLDGGRQPGAGQQGHPRLREAGLGHPRPPPLQDHQPQKPRDPRPLTHRVRGRRRSGQRQEFVDGGFGGDLALFDGVLEFGPAFGQCRDWASNCSS